MNPLSLFSQSFILNLVHYQILRVSLLLHVLVTFNTTLYCWQNQLLKAPPPCLKYSSYFFSLPVSQVHCHVGLYASSKHEHPIFRVHIKCDRFVKCNIKWALETTKWGILEVRLKGCAALLWTSKNNFLQNWRQAFYEI